MKKIFILLTSMFLSVGCANSLVLLGPATGAGSGKALQSSVQTGISYGIKKKTGKSPLEHVLTASKKTDEKICDSLKKEKSKSCNTITKKIILTDKAIKEKKQTAKKLALALQNKINEKSKIKYLD
jgi:hypothetical protein